VTSEPEPRDYFGQPFDPEEFDAAASSLTRDSSLTRLWGSRISVRWVPLPRFDPEEFDALAQMSPAQLRVWEEEWWQGPLDESERQDLLRLRLKESEPEVWFPVPPKRDMEDPERWELEWFRMAEREWQIQIRRMEEIAARAPMSPDQREAWEEEWGQRPLEESERQELLWLRLKESERQDPFEESERQELERLLGVERGRLHDLFLRKKQMEKFDPRLGPPMPYLPFRWEEEELELVLKPKLSPSSIIWDRIYLLSMTVTLAEAGAKSHLSVATIRRHLKAEQIPGAVRNPDRSWSIPVESLWITGIWAEGTWPAEPHDRYDHP